MKRDHDAAEIARHQNGLLTYPQACGCGHTDRTIDVRLGSGRWVLRRHGVYAIAGGPESERQTVLAACLAAGDGAMAARLTAARLWGIDLPAPDCIELVGPRRRMDGVRSHQSRTLVAADRSRIGAIPVTSPARTLVDCAGLVTPERLGLVLDDALRRGLVKLEALRRTHARIDTGGGRRPTVAMREVLLARAPGYSAGDSVREADIVRLLSDSGLPAPVLGHRVRVGRRSYKLDIAWPEVKLAIEFDGWDVHRTFTAFHGDRQRLRRLVGIGWTIVPATAQTDLHELIGDVSHLHADRWRASTA